MSRTHPGSYMRRSSLGTHVAGTGMVLAFAEPETMYEDQQVSVRLPSDRLKGDKLAAMSGPVISYNIYGILPDCQVCGQRMDPAFLRPFPGAPEVRACPDCISEGTGEVLPDAHNYS